MVLSDFQRAPNTAGKLCAVLTYYEVQTALKNGCEEPAQLLSSRVRANWNGSAVINLP